MKLISQISTNFLLSEKFLFKDGSEFTEKHYEQVQNGLTQIDGHNYLEAYQNEAIYKKIQGIENAANQKKLSPDEKNLLDRLITQAIETHLNNSQANVSGFQTQPFLNALEESANRILGTGLDNTVASLTNNFKTKMGNPDSWDWKVFGALGNINKKYGGNNYKPGDWWKINGEIATTLGVSVPDNERSFFGKAFQEQFNLSNADGMIGKNALAEIFDPKNEQMQDLLTAAKSNRNEQNTIDQITQMKPLKSASIAARNDQLT
jgi:hypothetical protein